MRRIALTVLCALATTAVLHLPQPAQAAGVAALQKVAVVEVQRVLLETRQGTKAKKKLEKSFAKSQTKLDRKTKELQKKAEDLRAKAAMLSGAELQKRQQELMIKDQELQQLYSELQERLAREEGMLVEKVYKNTKAIVSKIAAEDGIQIVLVRSPDTVVHASPRLDITNRVIVAYDKKHK